MNGILGKYGLSRLSVTHVSQQFWCERQVALSLEHPLTETAEMAAGTEIHRELMMELVDEVAVTARTPADELYLRMLNLRQGLEQVIGEGKTRELYVAGRVGGIPLSGVVDELAIDDGRLTILDHKTRGRPSLPPPPTFLTAEVQVRLYHLMLDDLRSGCYRFEEFYEDRKLADVGDVSSEFREELEGHGLSVKASVQEMGAYAFELFTRLPLLSDRMLVRYIHQGTGDHIGDKVVLHDPAYIDKKLKHALRYWTGEREPSPVSVRERWKCNYCEYRGTHCQQ